jgi:hypothetical protein
MRNSLKILMAFSLLLSCSLVSAQKDNEGGGTTTFPSTNNSARPGFTPDITSPQPDRAEIMEGFNDITNLPGWFMQNNSSPLGTTDWFQGNPDVFPAQSGASDAYIGANFNNTTGVGTISNWLLTPELDLSVLQSLSFWTRGPTASTFPDRLEVRLSTNGSSTNVGSGANDVGDFTSLMLEINPGLSVGGYPDSWTQFTVGFSSLSGTGRVGFRYFVTSGGPSGTNSDFIGIDTIETVESTGGPMGEVPTLGEWGMIAFITLLMLSGVFFMRRSRKIA